MIIFNNKRPKSSTWWANQTPYRMKIKVLIVEDNPITAQDIEEMLISQDMLVAGHARNAQQAINKSRDLRPDVILMDINLDGDIDGVDAVKAIYKTDYIPVVYLTANTDRPHVEKAYQTSPAAFIAKPFDEKDLVHAIELAFIHHCQESFDNSDGSNTSEMNKSVFLKNGERYEKVEIKDILYIEADGSYSKVVTETKNYSISLNLHKLAKKFDDPSFFRVHRSYIVNIKDISSFDNNHVFVNDMAIPYSKAHKEELMSHLHRL